MKKIRNILFTVLITISVSASAQILTAVSDLSIQSENNGYNQVLTWTLPSEDISTLVTAIDSVQFGVIRVRKSSDGVFYDSSVISHVQYVHSNCQYQDNNVSSCLAYTYYVVIEATLNGKILESSPSNGVQARERGANAVVIYPISKKTLVAVAGSLFSDTVYACGGSKVGDLTYSLVSTPSHPIPQDMTIDGSGIIHWDVPQNFTPGNVQIRVVVKGSNGAVSYTDLYITVTGVFIGSIDGKIFINGNKDSVDIPVKLTLFNTLTLGPQTITEVIKDTGSFSFNIVESGNYKLLITPRIPRFQPFWYSTGSNSLDTIDVNASGTTELSPINIVIPHYTKIQLHGALHDPRGAIANGTLQAFEVGTFFTNQGEFDAHLLQSAPDLFPSNQVTTDANGNYAMQVDTPGTYILLASAPGHQEQFIGPSGSQQSVSPYTAPTFTPNGTDSYNGNLNNSDTTGQQIVGTVKSIQSSVTGVRAMILLQKTSTGPITSSSGGIVPYDVVSSDSAGNFSISTVNRDTAQSTAYILQAVPYDSYIPAYYAWNDSLLNKILWQNAKTFQLNSAGGQPVEIDVTVQPLAQGAGNIGGLLNEPTDSGEQPSAHTFVYAVDDSTMIPAGYAITDGAGNFSIGNLPMGTYILYADKINFNYGVYDNGGITLTPDASVKGGYQFSLGSVVTGVHDSYVGTSSLYIQQNYPNPFASATLIEVTVPDNVKPGSLSLGVYDALGREVADLSNQLGYAVNNTALVSFTAHDLPAGIYFCRLHDGKGYTMTKQMILVR